MKASHTVIFEEWEKEGGWRSFFVLASSKCDLPKLRFSVSLFCSVIYTHTTMSKSDAHILGNYFTRKKREKKRLWMYVRGWLMGGWWRSCGVYVFILVEFEGKHKWMFFAFKSPSIGYCWRCRFSLSHSLSLNPYQKLLNIHECRGFCMGFSLTKLNTYICCIEKGWLLKHLPRLIEIFDLENDYDEDMDEKFSMEMKRTSWLKWKIYFAIETWEVFSDADLRYFFGYWISEPQFA